MLTLSMLEPSSAIAAATFASTPRWFFTVTRMQTTKVRPGSGAHSTSSHLSGSVRDLAAVGQSCVCTTIPWPFLIEPMMASPGIGRQHLANCTDIPSEPRMMIGPVLPSDSV